MLFLDTSALVKRYREEDGSAEVLAAMAADGDWVVSAVAAPEAELALCTAAGGAVRDDLLRRLRADLDACLLVPVDAECLALAARLGCRHGVRTLDAIHLAAADRLPRPVRFLTFDRRQAEAAAAVGLEVI